MPGRSTTRVLSPVLVALLAGACGPPDRAAPPGGDPPGIAVEDAEGRRVRLPAPARRVVSLVPSATLTLDALGARDVVVARTDFDTAAWTAPIPSVGGGLEPSVEAVLAARPDLVVRFGGPQDPRTPARLDELGIAHVAIRPDRIEDVMEEIRLLGTLTGREARADSLVAGLSAELAAVRAAAEGKPRVRVAYVLGGEPPWVAGPGTYIHELIELAGGDNVFADLGSLYAAVSPEEFVARTIDVILIPAGSRFDRSLVGGARLVEVGGALELPGPAVAAAAREVARLLHPEPGS